MGWERKCRGTRTRNTKPRSTYVRINFLSISPFFFKRTLLQFLWLVVRIEISIFFYLVVFFFSLFIFFIWWSGGDWYDDNNYDCWETLNLFVTLSFNVFFFHVFLLLGLLLPLLYICFSCFFHFCFSLLHDTNTSDQHNNTLINDWCNSIVMD